MPISPAQLRRETALAALEWTGAVGILLDDDLLHAARLTSETAAAVIERKGPDGRRFIYLGPRLDAPPMDVFEGAVLFDEPGVKAVEFTQRAHGLAHFLRATAGAGALLALLGRRAPEIRHLRRWLGADHPGAGRAAPAGRRMVRRQLGGMPVRLHRAGSGADLPLRRGRTRVLTLERVQRRDSVCGCGFTCPHRVDGGGRMRGR